jgi:hypothetical protein
MSVTFAAWQHRGARAGFEVVFLRPSHAEGDTTAVEDGEAWAVHYDITLDASWRTHGARIIGRAASGRHDLSLEADGTGQWRIDGAAAPHLDGCLDVDLESSAFTNALPVHRLALEIGQQADAPAAYVRARDLTVERLEQSYLRLDDQRYRYSAPRFDFTCELVYDESGLVVDYPGIAARVRA